MRLSEPWSYNHFQVLERFKVTIFLIIVLVGVKVADDAENLFTTNEFCGFPITPTSVEVLGHCGSILAMEFTLCQEGATFVLPNFDPYLA